MTTNYKDFYMILPSLVEGDVLVLTSGYEDYDSYIEITSVEAGGITGVGSFYDEEEDEYVEETVILYEEDYDLIKQVIINLE